MINLTYIKVLRNPKNSPQMRIFNPEAGIPVLAFSLIRGSHPHGIYTKSKYDGVEVQKDWNDCHGFVYLDKFHNQSFVDNGLFQGSFRLYGDLKGFIFINP